jgi:hypothetical protein
MASLGTFRGECYPGTPELGGGQEGQPPPLPFTRRGKGGKGALSI